MTKEELERCHAYTTNYDVLILNTQICGCFYCCQFFISDTIKEFVHDNTAALCPLCGIDTVIPLTCYSDMTKEFLEEMRLYWFESGEHNYLGITNGKMTQRTETNYDWQHMCLAPQDRKIIVRTKPVEYECYDDIIKVPAQEFEVTWNAKGNSWVDGELEETGTWSCFAGWLEPREVDAWKEIEENMNK
jgi:uncharacterized CHY-type Zn-finger protein